MPMLSCGGVASKNYGDIGSSSKNGCAWTGGGVRDDHCPAAIFGSLVGALGSAVGTWITQRYQGRRDLLAKHIVRRETLYSDFIAESARMMVDAMEHNDLDLQKMIPLYALLRRIRLSSSGPVLQAAEKIIKVIVNTYPQPNLTPEQIESRTIDGQDPLREFSNSCRTELDWMQRQV
jgi:hypothetical protein